MQHSGFSRIPKLFPTICADFRRKKNKTGAAVAFLQQNGNKTAPEAAGKFFWSGNGRRRNFAEMTKRREKSLAKTRKTKAAEPQAEALPLSIFCVFSEFGCGGPAARKRRRHGNGEMTSAQSFFSGPFQGYCSTERGQGEEFFGTAGINR